MEPSSSMHCCVQSQCRSLSTLVVLNSQNMASLCLLSWCLLMLGSAQTYATDLTGASNKTSSSVAVVNVTRIPVGRCPKPRSCDDDCGGAVAGAVVGSLLVGLVLGAIAMFYGQRYWKKRKMNTPPKDYTDPQSSPLDVNMNNGDRATRDSDDVATIPAGPQVKGHKKLERLSKLGPKPIPGPKPVLGLKEKPNVRSSVETPLIYIGPRNDKNSDNDISSSSPTTESDHNKIGKPPQQQQSNNSSVGGVDGQDRVGDNNEDDDDDQGNLYQEMDYTNIGLDAALSQPYDSLDVIPEEVEYANTLEYEQVGLVPRS